MIPYCWRGFLPGRLSPATLKAAPPRKCSPALKELVMPPVPPWFACGLLALLLLAAGALKVLLAAAAALALLLLAVNLVSARFSAGQPALPVGFAKPP